MTFCNSLNINWEKVGELLPAIIQEYQTGQVLMLGYMNREALNITCETGQVTFFSRTKNRLWMKGEQSGNVLQVVQILSDCDEDTLLILATIAGPCCHLNQPSCFGKYIAPFLTLAYLENVILSRYQERPANHYTTQLFEQGIRRIAQKVGEEGVEVALSATGENREEIVSETADLLYHLLVLLVATQVSFQEVLFLMQNKVGAK